MSRIMRVSWILMPGNFAKEQGETLILMAGAVPLCVGFAEWLALSPLIASLAVGATMVNLSARSRRLFDALSRTDPPLYAIFFVIAGADLNLALLPTLGVLGAVHMVGRAAGKFVGTRYGARWGRLHVNIQRVMGLAMVSQAGLAIGLVLVTNERFPHRADDYDCRAGLRSHFRTGRTARGSIRSGEDRRGTAPRYPAGRVAGLNRADP